MCAIFKAAAINACKVKGYKKSGVRQMRCEQNRKGVRHVWYRIVLIRTECYDFNKTVLNCKKMQPSKGTLIARDSTSPWFLFIVLFAKGFASLITYLRCDLLLDVDTHVQLYTCTCTDRPYAVPSVANVSRPGSKFSYPGSKYSTPDPAEIFEAGL